MRFSASPMTFEKDYDATSRQVPLIIQEIDETLQNWSVPSDAKEDLLLAADEAITNIIMHAYADLSDTETEKSIRVIMIKKQNILELILKDHGSSFDILKAPKPNVHDNLNGKRRGGFGVYLMKALMDHVRYTCKKGFNYTILVKRINGVER